MNIIDFHLDQHSEAPIYLQISDQVRQLIAKECLKPGDHLPTVRQLAQYLGVNQNTVVKAYAKLEQEKVVISRHGGGTVVSKDKGDLSFIANRREHLSEIVNIDIVKDLSLGYSPEEVEAAFYLHLARWREERKGLIEVPGDIAEIKKKPKTIQIVGSHDMALEILVDMMKHRDPGVKIEITNAGSMAGLIALKEGRAHLAGVHLLDEETGEYNHPYIKRVLPGREVAIVHLAYRIQGLMYIRGNPKNIKSMADLTRPDVVFVNRQKGAGTRILMDTQMRQLGIHPHEVKGYNRELNTHLAVGIAISHGEADVALGIEAAARSCKLDFLPLFREKYDLVMPRDNYRSSLCAPFMSMIISSEFREVMNEAGGYDTSQTGMVTFL
jgi:molybdate-binding protein/DNA-binding transcriptional regulator YhcF (GntR family)